MAMSRVRVLKWCAIMGPIFDQFSPQETFNVDHLKSRGLERALLVLDGAADYYHLAFMERDLSYSITVLALLPATTGKYQPADRLFGSLQTVVQWLTRADGYLLGPDNTMKYWEQAVLKLPRKPWSAAYVSSILGQAFRDCNLVPFTADEWTDADFASADARQGLHDQHPDVKAARQFDPATLNLAFHEAFPAVCPETTRSWPPITHRPRRERSWISPACYRGASNSSPRIWMQRQQRRSWRGPK